MRKIKRSWRRFYRTHREALDLAGDFIGTLSVFGMMIALYFLGIMVGLK